MFLLSFFWTYTFYWNIKYTFIEFLQLHCFYNLQFTHVIFFKNCIVILNGKLWTFYLSKFTLHVYNTWVAQKIPACRSRVWEKKIGIRRNDWWQARCCNFDVYIRFVNIFFRSLLLRSKPAVIYNISHAFIHIQISI